jgi:anti-anti-sigma regulatory factor
MIEFQLTDTGILVLKPNGPLRDEDFTALRQKLDPWLEEGGELKGLLIDAPDFPGWEDVDGLLSHLRFVREHHRVIPRVAFVSNSRVFKALPKVARHFVEAEIRFFEIGEAVEAVDWIKSGPAEAAHAIRHAWFPEQKIVWLAVDGKITSEEYRHFLKGLESILEEHSPISFLVDIEDLEGVEIGAMVADFKFAISHLRHFKRIALIGDQKWVHRLASLPNPFRLEFRSFEDHHEHEAWDWLVS